MTESEAFDSFYGDGYVRRLIRPLSSGKEASVYLCRATETAGGGLFAMKVYRSREQRAFKNNQAYKAGRVILNGHDRRAVAKKSRYGREFDEGWWVNREWEVLGELHEAGADVPRPVAVTDGAILMDYVGDEEVEAPQLHRVKLSASEARSVFDRVMWNVELALRSNLIHADLSAFNILWWDGKVTIIDLPQAVDPRSNPNASQLLWRDVANVCKYFQRFGVSSDPDQISRGLWMGFLFADL